MIVGAMVLVLGAMVFASIRQGQQGQKGTKVYVEEASQRAITQSVKASGQIDPRVKVNLSAHVIGKIERLYIEEGDEVEEGQRVLDLEKEAFLAVRDRAKAQLQIARTGLKQAKVDLKDAEIRQKRYRRLEQEGVFSAEEVERVELQYDSALIRVEQSEEEIQRVVADLEKAEDDLDKTTLYAPLSGRVIALNAEEGEVVVSGTMNNPASIIATIADLSEILAEVDVDENEIVDIAVGQEAEVIVDALPDEPYRGTVVEIGSSGFSNARQPDVTFFKVKVLLQDADERLRAGMSSRAEVAVASRDEALVIPIQAVVYRAAEEAEEDATEATQQDDEIQVVFVMQDDKAVQTPVTLGLADTTHVEIVEGLEIGDSVVTGPYRELKNLDAGDAVRLKDAAKDDDEEAS